MMFASGTSSVRTRLVGRTTRELGAMPIVHIIIAPIQTCIGITESPSLDQPGNSSKVEVVYHER